MYLYLYIIQLRILQTSLEVVALSGLPIFAANVGVQMVGNFIEYLNIIKICFITNNNNNRSALVIVKI